jgi:hypothetical protein
VRPLFDSGGEVTISDQDLTLFAARIRPHFEPELRDIAEELALGIARSVGARAKLLRPDTTFEEIFRWFHSTEPFPTSLDQVEWVMALEAELGIEISDDRAAKPQLSTFRDLVLERGRKRRA